MTELLAASLQFPTVVFTVGLGIALVYWVSVVLGALDIDVLGGSHATAAHGGMGDALAAAKGAGEGVVGAGHGGSGHDAGGAEASGGVWQALGLATVPLTVSLSIVLLIGWTLSLLLMNHVAPRVGSMGGLLPVLVLLATALISVPLAGRLVRPLGPLFRLRPGKSNRDYVGATCTITTGHVDEGFGQATVEDGGTVLVIPVRCDRPGVLARGQHAVIIEFDAARHAYRVEPVEVLTSAGPPLRGPG